MTIQRPLNGHQKLLLVIGMVIGAALVAGLVAFL